MPDVRRMRLLITICDKNLSNGTIEGISLSKSKGSEVACKTSLALNKDHATGSG